MTERVVLELDVKVVEAAEQAGLDLSAVLLEALRHRLPRVQADIRREMGARWYAENKEAIEAYNQMIERDGFVFSDGARTF
jgi:post-segregation antitoxin (ccd killing protein)